jgi:hypothetical protein
MSPAIVEQVRLDCPRPKCSDYPLIIACRRERTVVVRLREGLGPRAVRHWADIPHRQRFQPPGARISGHACTMSNAAQNSTSPSSPLLLSVSASVESTRRRCSSPCRRRMRASENDRRGSPPIPPAAGRAVHTILAALILLLSRAVSTTKRKNLQRSLRSFQGNK